MADITVTASAVRGAAQDTAVAAATLAAGKTLYKDTSSQWNLSDANVVAAASVAGISLHGADIGQTANALKSGNLTLQGGLTAGTFYFLSATPGGICPFADLVTGCRVVLVGYATSATNLVVHVVDTGVVLP